LAQRIRLDGATPHHQREQLTRYLNLMVEFRSEVMSRSTELSFSGWQKKVLNEIWSRRFGNGTLRSGVLLHHSRLLSGLPFAGSLCSG
jgi:hypothetical protein